MFGISVGGGGGLTVVSGADRDDFCSPPGDRIAGAVRSTPERPEALGFGWSARRVRRAIRGAPARNGCATRSLDSPGRDIFVGSLPSCSNIRVSPPPASPTICRRSTVRMLSAGNTSVYSAQVPYGIISDPSLPVRERPGRLGALGELQIELIPAHRRTGTILEPRMP